MSAHTPGPWELDYDTRPAEVCTIHGLPPEGELGQKWAHIRGAIGYWDADETENMANARLIMAAPELLAALTEARASVQANRDSLYECHFQPHTGDVDAAGRDAVDEDDALLSRIDAAIAKATGAPA